MIKNMLMFGSGVAVGCLYQKYNKEIMEFTRKSCNKMNEITKQL